jgi:ubiquinol-cytochrome c reductase cytochrome c subunit
MKRRGPGSIAAAVLVAILTASLRPDAALVARSDDPPAPPSADEDEREFQRTMARRSMQENCLICHSEEMITSQRLTAAQWKAEVEKMVGWGSPVPREQQPALVDYLAETFSDRAPASSPGRTTYRDALARLLPEPRNAGAPGDARRGEKLYAVNCASCHGPDAQGAELGPNLVERPVLLRATDYDEVVRDGRRRMPGFRTALSRAQESDILAWLRLRRYIHRGPG